MLVELKDGDTFNGHLVSCDTWMNLVLKEVVQTSADGEKFYRLGEAYIRGNNVCGFHKHCAVHLYSCTFHRSNTSALPTRSSRLSRNSNSENNKRARIVETSEETMVDEEIEAAEAVEEGAAEAEVEAAEAPEEPEPEEHITISRPLR